MRIKIAQRLRPFSHIPGTYCLLPGTSLRFQIFPTRLILDDLSAREPRQLKITDLNLSGPANDFTVQQDLEKGIIHVWGQYQEGYIRYSIFVEGPSAVLRLERAPSSGVGIKDPDVVLHRNDRLSFPDHIPFFSTISTARLSLGCHKAQDWELVKRRADMKEILPFWCRLGQSIPEIPFSGYEGTLHLLKTCEETMHDNTEMTKAMLDLFQAGFEGMLSPRLIDSQYQGFGASTLSNDFYGSSLSLLTEGAKLMTGLFLQIHFDEIHILPVLPPAFHCGRMTDFACGHFGHVAIEWSKKTIRRLIFHSSVNGALRFRFKKGVKRCRIRRSFKEKGKWMRVDDPLDCQEGGVYFLDRFEH